MQAVRHSAVAGRFYPADPAQLRRDLGGYLGETPSVEPAISLIVPHAGYMFSGAIAGRAYARVEVPDRTIVLCPNHTGFGRPRSIWTAGAWETPLGRLVVDVDLARRLALECGLDADSEAHLREHAIEVQLPFLQALNPNVRVVPICLGHLSYEECQQIGAGIARVIHAAPDSVLMVASTDMSHYLPADKARELDREALDRMLELDPLGLYQVVTRRKISMCGFVPTTVTLEAARALHAENVELVAYGNSGETTGDLSSVVGYASLIVRKPGVPHAVV